MNDQTPARRPRRTAPKRGVSDTSPLPAVKPKRNVSVAEVAVQQVIEQSLTDGGALPTFTTNELTTDMVAEIIAAQLDGNPSLFRTDAGMVTVECGLTADKRVIVTLKHWRSFNGAQTYDAADDDQRYQVEIKLGAMVPVREPEPMPDTIEGILLKEEPQENHTNGIAE